MIVTAGAWSTRMLTELNLPIHILRKTLWWQEVVDAGRFDPERFPVFITDSPAGEIYGFPTLCPRAQDCQPRRRGDRRSGNGRSVD